MADLAKAVAELERKGETVVQTMQHGNAWVVLTSKPRSRTSSEAKTSETSRPRFSPGP